MVAESFSGAISATFEYFPHDSLTVARLDWLGRTPSDQFTVDLGKFASIGFDIHVPVRPVSVSIFDIVRQEIGAEEQIEVLFGGDFVGNLNVARVSGWAANQLYLTLENRRELARLEFNSPSAPPNLRRLAACVLTGVDAGVQPVFDDAAPVLAAGFAPQASDFKPDSLSVD